MSGFKNEKEIWKYQKPRLRGNWERYELVTPAGHPDVKGSHKRRIIYIENKVGDEDTAERRRKAMQASQVTYCDWLVSCGHDVYVCFGSPSRRSVTFYHWLGRLLIPTVPAFWSHAKLR